MKSVVCELSCRRTCNQIVTVFGVRSFPEPPAPPPHKKNSGRLRPPSGESLERPPDVQPTHKPYQGGIGKSGSWDPFERIPSTGTTRTLPIPACNRPIRVCPLHAEIGA